MLLVLARASATSFEDTDTVSLRHGVFFPSLWFSLPLSLSLSLSLSSVLTYAPEPRSVVGDLDRHSCERVE